MYRTIEYRISRAINYLSIIQLYITYEYIPLLPGVNISRQRRINFSKKSIQLFHIWDSSTNPWYKKLINSPVGETVSVLSVFLKELLARIHTWIMFTCVTRSNGLWLDILAGDCWQINQTLQSIRSVLLDRSLYFIIFIICEINDLLLSFIIIYLIDVNIKIFYMYFIYKLCFKLLNDINVHKYK